MKKLKYIIISISIFLISAAAIPCILPLTDRTLFTGNYRIPFSLGEDYFLYSRYSKQVASGNTIPVIGDSVIWGHYTDNENTIPARLNRLNTKTAFTNMGLDGIHPAAMNGLMNIYTADFKNRKIIAGVNLLWMSSPRHDLTGPVNSEINHKTLLPQIYPEIPSYKPAFEERVSSLITRAIPFFSWIDHIRLTHFAEKSFYLWTMENPHRSLLEYFSHKEETYMIPDGMQPAKMQEQNIDWVTTDKSLQWKFMVDTLLSLKKQGNEVAALITPFNTYMMTEKSRKEYFSILAEMEWILRENGITPVIPLILDKKYFADSSHPTAEGYKLIAEDLMKNREFLDFIGK
ncbi:MAG TPA: hypothetical protein PKG60_04025 [Spirochaetota bacterium]|nr:hypothetical protein [Spirochaetota bacterium]HPS85672.1 hypothetical protein [Spirochaetota bacterium]